MVNLRSNRFDGDCLLPQVGAKHKKSKSKLKRATEKMEKSNINHCVRFKILFIYLFIYFSVHSIHNLFDIQKREKQNLHKKKKKNLYLMIDAI